MDKHFYELGQAVKQTAWDHQQAVQRLEVGRRTCTHAWGATQYTPVVTGGYSTQSLMGPFHLRGDGTTDAPTVWVERQESPKWTCTCMKCGQTESTTQVTVTETKTPKF